jgi:two-component system response regulator RegX3
VTVDITFALDTEEIATSITRGGRRLILVVDGDASYREVLASVLSREGFEVESAAAGHQALSMFRRIQPDLVLLDAVLPDQSGIDLCRRMQEIAPVPIIIVTARNSEVETVLGLEIGATDYVSKPFRVRELVARMRAVLRRMTPRPGDEAPALDPIPIDRARRHGQARTRPDEVVDVGAVRLDLARRQVQVPGRTVDLSSTEFDLLHLLMSNAGHVVTRESCMNQVWHGRSLLDTRTLDTHVMRIRRKIESDRTHPRHIITHRGLGFRFEA